MCSSCPKSPILTSLTSTPAEKASFLKEVQNAYGIYAAIYLTDIKGTIIAATNQTVGSQTGMAWFTNTQLGQIYVSDVYYLTSVQGYVVTLSTMILGTDGSEVGIVAAHVDARNLFSLVGDRRIGRTGQVFLVNTAGRIAADQDIAQVLNDVNSLTPIQAVMRGERGTLIDSNYLNEEPTLYGYAPLKGIERWAAVGVLPIDELNEPIQALAVRTGLIALIVAVLISLLIIPLTGSIVDPIQRLTTRTRQVAAGDFTIRAQEPSRRSEDEIGQLTTSFEQMAAAIDERDGALLKQTRDLQRTNADLEIATAQAQEAVRLRGEFLANVSHELRTPLNAIIGFSDMLLMGIQGDLNDKQTHKITRLRENGLRLLALINDLLDLTRLEAGRVEIVMRPFAPRLLVERIAGQMQSLADAAALEFNVIVSAGVPALLNGDEQRIEQIVVNLLSNAFKFTHTGSVTLAVDSLSAEQTWTITVTDTGIGISPHAVDIIFEEFRQVDGSYTRAYKGTGLGLAITRNLTRLMGGKISVQSVLGTGSTFTVSLPMVEADSQPAASTTQVVETN